MMSKQQRIRFSLAVTFAFSATLLAGFARHRLHNQTDELQQSHRMNAKWMNASLSPDERADMVLKEMTLHEKIDLVHGNGMPGWPGKPRLNAYLGNGGAGFVLGVARLG